jgi:hypothetical protein
MQKCRFWLQWLRSGCNLVARKVNVYAGCCKVAQIHRSIKYIILYIIYICIVIIPGFKYLPLQLCNFATTPTGKGFELQPELQPLQLNNHI